MDKKIKRSDDEWKAALTPEQYAVTREKATERAFTGEYHDCEETGVYRCVCCGNDLFRSVDKFDSGSGWPSFSRSYDPERIRLEQDRSLGLPRVEVLCKFCDAHLGHVFDDGPDPTGRRFCINSAALELEKEQNG